MNVDEAKQAVLETAQLLLERGLVSGTSGNVSARVDDGTVCITPSSVPYETMTIDDLTIIDLDGEVVQARDGRHPSSEKALHTYAYRSYEEINSVIHAHPVHTTMFAVVREPIPAVIDEFALYVGGDVPVCPYAASGTDELAKMATEQLARVGAALLANHGLVAIGPSTSRALHITTLVERAAQIVHGAKLLGAPVPLPEKTNADFAEIYALLRQTP